MIVFRILFILFLNSTQWPYKMNALNCFYCKVMQKSYLLKFWFATGWNLLSFCRLFKVSVYLYLFMPITTYNWFVFFANSLINCCVWNNIRYVCLHAMSNVFLYHKIVKPVCSKQINFAIGWVFTFLEIILWYIQHKSCILVFTNFAKHVYWLWFQILF
jgi:hypothetical protein